DIPPEKLDLNFSFVDNTTHPALTVTAEEDGTYTLQFSKFMQPETVSTDTIAIDELTDVQITPVYLDEGDAYADTFTVSGTQCKKDIAFAVSAEALSYSGVSAEADTVTIVNDVVLGDVNGDGTADVRDVTAMQRCLADAQELSFLQMLAADTNQDGTFDINDATCLQSVLAEYVTDSPVGLPL
ncbi:MAG: dockerin type I repeat-containing protein, partial [Ruminococcus sp.]|nr:dockerin type I repeat-containing protein [Ruminococcus sp.]